MTAASTNPAAFAPRRSPWRRRLLWLSLALVATAAATAPIWIRYLQRAPLAVPPTPDLQGVDPAVAAIIERERGEVLRQPRSAAAWGRFGEALEIFNFRTDAAACFAQAEQLDPKEPRWPYHWGLLLLSDNGEEAIVHLRRAVELCGDSADVPRLRLSETLLAQGHLDEAEVGFLHLLQRDELHPRANLGLGRLAMRRQRWRDALLYLRRAAADSRTRRAGTLALAEAHLRLGENEAAEQFRVRLDALPPDPDWPDKFLTEIQHFNAGRRVRLMRADQYFKQGHVAEAIAMYGRVVQDYPESDAAWNALGQALFRVRDFAGAEQALRTAVRLTPGFAEAHNYLGLARLEQGKLESAAASFRTAIDLKPDFAPAYSNLGRCLIRQNNRAGAIAAFRAAVRCKPDYVGAYLELAELLHQDQQHSEAREQVRRALQVNPSDTRAKQLQDKLAKK